jgi:hypothetical protein
MVAPMTMVECGRYWFYDINGFIENGRPTRTSNPPFDQTTEIVELDSVGSFVSIDADIYRNGATHADAGFTEWQSVGAATKRQGRPVLTDTRLRVLHAFLPNYGESWH